MLLKACTKLGFQRPTAIQEQVIPFALQGRDILATAQTGSGKTAAFLLPILERLIRSEAVSKRRLIHGRIVGGAYATKALILLPTRELAAQCFEMLEGLSQFTPVTKILVTGGLSQQVQLTGFRRQPDIVVATPGRILDMLLNASSIHIELLEIVVLDEADRLLEMGFKQECLEILSHCSRGHQTLLFSATLSEAINDLALLSLRNPIRFNVSKSHSLPSTLRQITVPVPTEKKITSLINRESILLHLCLTMFTKEKTLVFFRTKKAAHRASLIFRLLSIRHAELHGNLPQSKRLEALESFHKDSSVRFLLCSELAARGLDIASVDLVINFMVPPETSRYIHQAGRTARLGRNGICITLYSPDEKLQLKRIIRQSSKTTFPASKLIIPPNEYEGWIKKLHTFSKTIEEILSKEHLEKEIRLAEREAQKGINMHMYEDEIMSRPRKTWLSKKMLSTPSNNVKTNSMHETAFNKMDAFVPKESLSSTENDPKSFRNSLDEENMSDSSGSLVNANFFSPNVNANQTNRRYSQKGDTTKKKPLKKSPVTEKPDNVKTKQSTKPLSSSERKRLIKERVFQNKKLKPTPKQKAALKARLPCKAVGSKVKRKRRLANV
ncbi:uncharacterized protein LOC128883570 isoform X2 [Hylaeus volcanicus]|nr:uncharacterized protein LOC128883570 isoform X2 [Hylaeus volcanicus]